MIKPVVYAGLLVGLLIPLASWAGPIGPITQIVVAENGIGPASEGCAAYTLTQKQVRSFFDKAVVISGRQEHDFFLYGPCSARGTLKTRYDTWQWEIRNLGTGSVTATNEDTFRLGDPSQESSLGDD